MVGNTNRKRRPSLSISEETKRLLDSIKHRGQTYDGAIQELIDSWKTEQEVEETRQRLQLGAGRSR